MRSLEISGMMANAPLMWKACYEFRGNRSQKVINFKDRECRFYFYKLKFSDGDDVSYSLACAGPFYVKIKAVSSKDAFGQMYYDEDFDESKNIEQMDNVIKQMENGFEWNNKKD